MVASHRSPVPWSQRLMLIAVAALIVATIVLLSMAIIGSRTPSSAPVWSYRNEPSVVHALDSTNTYAVTPVLTVN